MLLYLSSYKLGNEIEVLKKWIREKYEGLNILDFIPVPHYKSDHPESHLVDKVIEVLEQRKIKYKPLSDGEVIIMNK